MPRHALIACYDYMLLLGSCAAQSTLGRKLPKVTLVENAIPPNKVSLDSIPHVAFLGFYYNNFINCVYK